MEQATQPCPACGAALPVDLGYVSWCHDCGWNLAPPETRAVEGRMAGLYQRAGARLGDRLAGRLVAADSLAPRLTPARFGAYLIAGLVHLTSLGLFVWGLALVVTGYDQLSVLIPGLLIAALGVALRPRLGKAPKENVLVRADAASLFRIVDGIAARMGTKPVDLIVVDERFNASWSIVGVRRQRVLTLGLPLLAALGPEERAALIAHELAHGKNGDSSRGLFVGSALRDLTDVYYVLAPGGAVYTGQLALPARLAGGLLWLLSRPILGLLLLELHLLLRDSQRAEYLADALAAQAVGTRAVVGLHEKMLLEQTVRGVTQRLLQDRGDSDLFDAIARAVSAVPERELERRRRVARLETARLDVTHPPTGHRIRLLEERPLLQPAVAAADWSAADRELAAYRAVLQGTILDNHRDRLYRRYA